MSHPAGLPDLFLDRSLGRKKVPELLRAEGLHVVTLADHYGIPADETIEDSEWLQLCGQRGWLALMKDDRIRYVGAERHALVMYRVRAAVITNANLPAQPWPNESSVHLLISQRSATHGKAHSRSRCRRTESTRSCLTEKLLTIVLFLGTQGTLDIPKTSNRPLGRAEPSARSSFARKPGRPVTTPMLPRQQTTRRSSELRAKESPRCNSTGAWNGRENEEPLHRATQSPNSQRSVPRLL